MVLFCVFPPSHAEVPVFTPAALQRRMQRVRVLLETHDEPYDTELSRGERSATGFSEPRPRRYLCGVCAGDGCERCSKGRVLIEERDAYDEGEKGFWAAEPAKTMSPAQVERELKALRQTELQRADVIGDIDFEASLEAAERRDSRGSYQTLRVALDFLPASLRGEDAVRWLAENIPGPIRVPRWAFNEELDGIDAEVLELKGQGLKISEIAEALSVPQRQVKTALRRARPAA